MRCENGQPIQAGGQAAGRTTVEPADVDVPGVSPGELINKYGAPAPEASVDKMPAAGLTVEVSIGLFGALPAPAPLASRGRPTCVTPEVQERLCMLLSLGLSRRQAAAYLDIDHSTISRAASRDQELARRLSRAEQMSGVQPLLNVVAASRKNWRAAAWLLQHKAKYPPALSPEEKEEKHQAMLEDGRRIEEYLYECHAHHNEIRRRE